ncbi:MAG: glycosyltransferase [Bacteroidota bacterium]
MDSPTPLRRLPHHVVHYSEEDPATTTGGVQTFARSLALLFEEVSFMTPATRDEEIVRAGRLPVICDNHFVADWSADIPVIGFQHGVGAVKFEATRSLSHWRLQRRQRRAAKRPGTLWVACAQWIAATFERLYGNGASHVIYHSIDVERFDGRLRNAGSRLLLHDARLKHKGRDLMPVLARAFPAWTFEPLACAPADVPDRMRGARAFIHLSRYEGNSIVCNEAMAMNLPCLFTQVGLMQDADRPTEVVLVDPDRAFSDPDWLVAQTGHFLDMLDSEALTPRDWVLTQATRAQSIARWSAVMNDFQGMPWEHPRPS